MKKRIAVVGAGIAGLSCAYELQKQGFEVVVFEQDDHVGGRMWTSEKKGFAFDVGADFLVDLYKNTRSYCDELGIGHAWQPMGPGKHYTLNAGGLRLLSISSIWSVLGFDSLSFKSRIRLILFLARAGAKIRGLNFFDLASAPEELDMDNAYAYARDQIGQDVAEYIVDGITTTYQFHRSSEISTTGMFALAGLTANSSEGFTMYHTIGEMRTIPCELAKRLDVRTKTQVSRIEPHKGKVAITATGKRMKFDTVVCASTGDRAREMLIKPSRKQAELLASVRYASSINISYKIPVEVLSGISAVTVPHIENPSISGYTNESLKGICVDGKTLINVYLHEGWARKMMKKSEKEIFTQVKGELVKVCPPLDGRKELLEDHEIQRWPSAMPKFDHKYVTRVKRFWQDGQGDNGVYLCGDYLNTPWVEGSITCGKKVAAMIAIGEKGSGRRAS